MYCNLMTNICHRLIGQHSRALCARFSEKIAGNADKNCNESYYFSTTSDMTEAMCVCEYGRHIMKAICMQI